MDNRRKSPRVTLATIARITPHGLQTSVEALVRDISAEGIGVYVKGRYQPGDMLLLKMSFVTDTGETIKESVMGRVAWAKRLEEEQQSAVGIQLPDMEQKHPQLYAYVKHLEELNS